MLKVEHITTGYGKKQVLTDVSFEVKQGEIVLLSGENGSGKSTVLKTIYGLLKPWTKEGKIFFQGENIIGLHTSEMIRRGIVYMPQKKNVFEDFTVEENLLTSASIYSKKESKLRLEKAYETIPLLTEMKKRTPFHMSGGEKQLLAFGNILVHFPKLILLDEPLSGLDDNNTIILSNAIETINKYRVSFVIVEHSSKVINNLNSIVLKLELGTINNKI